MVKLPTYTQFYAYSFICSLDESEYKFRFRWLMRPQAWYFDILTPTDVPILMGNKVVLGAPLLRRYQIEALPPGDLIVVDTTGALTTVGRADLGTKVEIIYLSEAEIPVYSPTSAYQIEFAP